MEPSCSAWRSYRNWERERFALERARRVLTEKRRGGRERAGWIGQYAMSRIINCYSLPPSRSSCFIIRTFAHGALACPSTLRQAQGRQAQGSRQHGTLSLLCIIFRLAGRKMRVPSGRQGMKHDQQAKVLIMCVLATEEVRACVCLRGRRVCCHPAPSNLCMTESAVRSCRTHT